MTLVSLRPNGTIQNTGAVTGGGGTAHGATSDDSDASFVTLDFGEIFHVDLGDLSLPAGAVIKALAIRLRGRVTGSSVNLGVTTGITGISSVGVVTWTVATTWTTVSLSQAGFTDSQIDGAYMRVVPAGSSFVLYEAYLDVTYVAKPVVSADAPSGTLTDTNLPLVEWTNTLDSAGGAQTSYAAKIFTQAQYTAGGFDPALTTPFAGGSFDGAATSYQVDTPLPDGTYRAYVQTVQTVNGQQHLSDYDSTEFTVDVDLPGTPTLVATADDMNARIALAVTNNAGAASTDRFQLERSLDGGTTFEPVRTLDAGRIDVPFVVAVGELADAADGTSHAVPLPNPTDGIQANDLLIAVSGMDGNPSFTWPSDWTEIKDEAGNGSAVRAGVAWKRASGGETGTITVTTSASEGGGTRILCIRGAHTETAPEVSTGVSSAAANANPDALNPAGWGTEPTLWIAAMVNDGNVAVTAAPSGYFNFGNTRWANASGAGVATAELFSVAASADPGAFTNAAEDSRAFTIGVRPRNATLTVYDYEAPNGTTVQYRARALHDYNGVWAAGAWGTDSDAWSSTSWWLKHPYRPELNVTVVVRSFPSLSREARQGVFQALGATNAVVVQDTRGPKRGVVTLYSDSEADQEALDALLDTVETLMLQSPAGQGGPDYVRFGNHERNRIVDWHDATRVFEPIEFVAVASPAGDVVAWP